VSSTLTKEQIEQLLGPQPKIGKIEETPNKLRGWVCMTDEEKKRIIEFKKKRPTYNLDELSKKFGRSKSSIWKLIKDL